METVIFVFGLTSNQHEIRRRKNDIAFRKIFGNEHRTEVLVSSLNAVLDLPYYYHIHQVTIPNPFLLPRLKGEKASR